jgi:hypothetical protein
MTEQDRSIRRAEPKASRPYMPGYGILDPGAGKGLLPWSWAAERLTQAHTYWVATTRPDGRPHLMPVWGIWLDDGFYFSTGRPSRKARNLAANPQGVVSVEVGDAAIIAEGIVEQSDHPELLRRFAGDYGAKYQWDMEGFSEPVYVLRPAVAFAFISGTGEFTGTATRWIFDGGEKEGPA